MMRFLLPRTAAVALVLSAGSVFAQDPEDEDRSPPRFDEAAITDYTVGVAHPVIDSSYDYIPQIQRLPSEPQPRVVPRPKKAQRNEDGTWSEVEDSGSVEDYAGFDGLGNTGWNPPDPSLAVGPDHIVSVVNSSVAWWDKKTATLQFSAPLGSQGNPGFFEPVGGGSFCFDPKCLYDEQSGRYFVLALEYYSSNSTAYITFAVSDDSNPNGTWYKYRTVAKTRVGGQDYWVDYPGIGVDDQAFYVTGNLFGFSGGFAGVKYRVLPKSSILTGGSVSFLDLRDGGKSSAQCAHMYTTVGFPYFISVDSNEAFLQAIQNPTTSPSLFTKSVPITSWSSPPGAPNQGGGTVDTLDGRIMNAEYRDKRLLAAHGVAMGGRSVSRWYEFRMSDWPASGNPSKRQEGTVNFGSGIYSFFPAISKNSDKQIAMVTARSASGERLSVWSAWQNNGDASGDMPNSYEMRAGDSSYGGGRYGDYFDIAQDPVNDKVFWGIGEFPGPGGIWETYIGTLGTNPAQTNYIGSGSPGTGGVIPFLRVLKAKIGKFFRVRINSTPPDTNFFLLVGFSTTNLVFNGAELYVSPPWAIVYPGKTDAIGEWTIDAPLDIDPGVIGPAIYVQGLFFDGGAPQGVSSSRAAEVFIGDD